MVVALAMLAATGWLAKVQAMEAYRQPLNLAVSRAAGCVDAAARHRRSELAVPALPPMVAGPILLPRLTQLAMAILGALATRSRSSTDWLRVC